MALVTTGDVREQGAFTPEEFNWDAPSDSDLSAMLQQCVAVASAETKFAAGTGNYASADADTIAVLTMAELYRATSLALRRRLVILSSRPEEAPPPIFIDLNILKDQIADYDAQWTELVSLYRTDETGQPGMGFAGVATGVLETQPSPITDYSQITYGGPGLEVPQAGPIDAGNIEDAVTPV